MSTLTLTPLTLDRVDRAPTLDDLLAGVWEGLSAGRAVRCPVCAGEMRAVGLEPIAGVCSRCAAELR